MGQIGYGYGSEWHLLRLKANHQQWFNQAIQGSTALAGDIQWLDFGFDGVMDQEITDETLLRGIASRYGKDPDALLKAYYQRWVGGGHLNFDSVLLIGNTLVPIEAKGHLEETMGGAYRPHSKNEEQRQEQIAAMNRLLEKPFVARYGCPSGQQLYTSEDYYQFANRVMFIDFLKEQGIPCKLIYLLFLGAWDHSYGHTELAFRSAEMDDWMSRYMDLAKRLGITPCNKAFNDEVGFLLLPANGEAWASLYPVGQSKDE